MVPVSRLCAASSQMWSITAMVAAGLSPEAVGCFGAWPSATAPDAMMRNVVANSPYARVVVLALLERFRLGSL